MGRIRSRAGRWEFIHDAPHVLAEGLDDLALIRLHGEEAIRKARTG
jgi:hypothetical protein